MSSFLDQTPGSRDLAAKSDGVRVLSCMVKRGPIAAGRCVEEQAASCFCPGAFNALRGYEATLGEDFSRETPEDKARRAASRVQLATLKARAAGFARQPEAKQFAGPALTVENERRRRAKLGTVEEAPAPAPAPPVPPPRSIAPPARASVDEVAAAVEAQRQPKPEPNAAGCIPCPKCKRPATVENLKPHPRAEGEVCGRCRAAFDQPAGVPKAQPHTGRFCKVEPCGFELGVANKSGICGWHKNHPHKPRPPGWVGWVKKSERPPAPAAPAAAPAPVEPPAPAPAPVPAEPTEDQPLVECPKCHRGTRKPLAAHPKFAAGPVCGNCHWNLTHSKEPEDRAGGPRLGWRPCATVGCTKQVQVAKGHDTCSYCRSGSRAHLTPAGELASLRARVVELEAASKTAAGDYEKLHRELVAVEEERNGLRKRVVELEALLCGANEAARVLTAERDALRLQVDAPAKEPGQDDEIDTIRALLVTIGKLTSAGRLYLGGRLAEERPR